MNNRLSIKREDPFEGGFRGIYGLATRTPGENADAPPWFHSMLRSQKWLSV